MRKRRRDDVAADLDGIPDVLDGHAVCHDKGLALGTQVADRLCEGPSVRAGTVGRIECDDVGARVHAGNGMAQRRRDVDPLMPFLPEADDGDLDPALDGSDVGESLAADGSASSLLAGLCHLCHGLGMAKRLSRIGLDRDNELAFERLNQRRDFHLSPP